jgi:ankyrin repeat protein
MRKKPASPNDSTLMALLAAIATRDGATVKRLLAQSPLLARQAVVAGATRENASAYFFAPIAHYAYAGDTPLHIAAAAYDAENVSELIAHRADVRARNRRGAEPLHYATDGIPGAPHWNPAAQSAVIALLIDAGADPNCADKSGVAPLHPAVRTRCAAAVDALLRRGADARRQNGSGSTPLHLAVQDTGRGGSGAGLAREQQAEIIGLLLRAGARAADLTSGGKTVRACAAADWIHALLDQQ